ncbi:MAG: hypothetical protein AAGF66_17530 [Cyanobacteria bacterium P01_H01_bin.119]
MKGWIGLAVTVMLTGMPLMAQGKVLLPNSQFILPAQTKQADAPSELLAVEGELEAGDATFGDDNRRLDAYEFQGEAGQVVTLTVESDDFTPFVALFDGTTGEAVASAVAEDGNPATATATLPSDGQYSVGIAAIEIPGEGSYRLSVTADSAAASQPSERLAEADRWLQ